MIGILTERLFRRAHCYRARWACMGGSALFYQGQKYGLNVTSAKIGRVWITAVDLIGHCIRNPADIIATYTAADPGFTIVQHGKMVRLENASGAVLQISPV